MVMGQLTTKVDVAVIGGGPAGYNAAIRAAQLGLEVMLIEKNELGGTCTNVGCIPTKALIHAAKTKKTLESEATKAMGIRLPGAVSIDFAQTQRYKDGVVKSVRNGISTLCRLNGVEVVKGRAFFTSSNALALVTDSGMRTVEFKNAVIAVGTKIKGMDNLPCDHEKIIDSDDALALNSIPGTLLVVGGGYIAVEMACMFMDFGSKVTVVYRGERLLKNMDRDIGEHVAKRMIAKGGQVLFKSEIESVQGDTAIVKTPEGKRPVVFERMLVAVGRELDFDDLGLEKTKIQKDNDGRIIVDETMKTTDEGIYAIGDVVPGPQLAHKAFREGKVAAEAIAGQKSAFDNVAIPMVVFSDPVMASVGMSEEQAKELGYSVKIGKMPFSASGKAKIIGDTEGFVKIVADESGAVLGVQMIGPGAEDLIAEASLAVEMGAMLEDLAATIHAHPTLPETLGEAAEDALGKAVHLFRSRR